MRLVLCDDHRLYVEPLAAALEMRGHEPTVVTRPDEAVRAVDLHEPGMVLIDLWYPDGDAISAIGELRTRHPACPVVALTASADPDDLGAVRRAGASGFLRKDQPITAVFDAVDRITHGRPVAPPPPPRARTDSAERAQVRRLVQQLTGREREVLLRLVEAEDTVRIARSLGVAPSTARTHLQNVLLKLGVHTRLQAVAMVVTAGVDTELP